MSDLEAGTSNLTYVVVALAVIAGVAAVGSVGYLSGAGWFGHRQILYGSGQIYLLNMGDKPLEVSAEGREPVEVPPEDARVLDVVGGESKVVVRDAGKVVAEYDVFLDNSHALLKLSDEGCLAASDVGAFYGRGGEELEFVEMIGADDRLFVPGTTNVIWPRETFPAKLSRDGGDAIWVELVGCALLDQPKFLRGYLDVRLGQRLGKARGEPK